MTSYAIVGLDIPLEIGADYTGGLNVLKLHDEYGTESVDLVELALPDEAARFVGLHEALTMANRLVQWDLGWWPPFYPVIAETIDGKLVRLLRPKAEDEGGPFAAAVQVAARRWGLEVGVA